MRTKAKTFDCVGLMHEGAKRVQDATKDMTLDEKLAYWNKAYREMTPQPGKRRSKKA